MGTLVSIGEFSRLTHLSVKALRHYHEVGVLVPADIDARNRYRRYDLNQLPDAYVVRRLRDLDMPLDEVKGVLDTPGGDSRDRAIAEHLARMEVELAHTREVVASLRKLLTEPATALDVQHRRIGAVHAVVERSVVSGDDVEAWSKSTFAELERKVALAGLTRLGPSGSRFSSEYFERGAGEVVAFVPVADGSGVAGLEAEVARLAGGEYAVALHRGHYVDLDLTYGALGSYVAEHGIAAEGPIVEFYLVGSDTETDPAAFRTEVCRPISVQ